MALRHRCTNHEEGELTEVAPPSPLCIRVLRVCQAEKAKWLATGPPICAATRLGIMYTTCERKINELNMEHINFHVNKCIYHRLCLIIIIHP